MRVLPALLLLLASTAKAGADPVADLAKSHVEGLGKLETDDDKLGLATLRDDADRVLRANYPNSAFLRRGFAAREKPWWKIW